LRTKTTKENYTPGRLLARLKIKKKKKVKKKIKKKQKKKLTGVLDPKPSSLTNTSISVEA
jgi:hypothetical protein